MSLFSNDQKKNNFYEDSAYSVKNVYICKIEVKNKEHEKERLKNKEEEEWIKKGIEVCDIDENIFKEREDEDWKKKEWKKEEWLKNGIDFNDVDY